MVLYLFRGRSWFITNKIFLFCLSLFLSFPFSFLFSFLALFFLSSSFPILLSPKQKFTSMRALGNNERFTEVTQGVTRHYTAPAVSLMAHWAQWALPGLPRPSLRPRSYQCSVSLLPFMLCLLAPASHFLDLLLGCSVSPHPS